MKPSAAFIEKARRREQERQRRAVRRTTGKNRVFVPIAAVRPPPDDWHTRIRYAPDTRTMTGRLLGDPRPGRAAIDIGKSREI